MTVITATDTALSLTVIPALTSAEIFKSLLDNVGKYSLQCIEKKYISIKFFSEN